MAVKMFMEKTDKPDDKSLSQVLGPNFDYWMTLKKHLNDEYGPLVEEWKYYNTKSGWTMKMLRKKRNLFFFSAMDGFFSITFVFGDRAVAVVEKSVLPQDLIQKLLDARKYMEGRGLQVEVHSPEDVAHVKALVKIKIEY